MPRRTTNVRAARATIGLVLVGIPAALVFIAGNPLPTSAQWSAVIHLEPDWGNTVLLGSVLPCAAWLAWALFAYPLIAELLRHRLGHPVLPVGALPRSQQQLAAALVTAALLSSSPALATPGTIAAQTMQVTDLSSGTEQVDLAAFRAPAHGTDAASQQTHSTTSTVTTYEVRKGDTLWDIAERRLGGGSDYPAIAKRSADILQPDGRHLTDPDLILPGWHLDIPTTNHTAPSTPPTAPPAHHGPRPTATATAPMVQTPAPTAAPSPTGTPKEPATAGPSADSADHDGSHDADAAQIAIGGGAAALLAAGLVTVLTRRRHRQRAGRRFGERLPMPTDGPALHVEEQLRAVSDPEAVASLHRALASVLAAARQDAAPLPSLFAVRIDDSELTLYLHEPASLPSPFEPLFSDGTAWTAPRDAFTIPVEPHTAAPYPALVTVGTDLDGGILLLDLEQQAHLRLASPDKVTGRGMLNALTAELASSPWGEDIHLSLVGVSERLATELDPYRIHQVADTSTLIRDIRTHLADRQVALDAAGVPDARIARVHLADVEAWAPFVVLIGTPPTPDEQTELDDLVRQHATSGLVVITTQHGTTAAPEIALMDTSATYRSGDPTLPPLPFIPQLLDEHNLEQTLQIFTRAATTSENVAVSQPPFPRTVEVLPGDSVAPDDPPVTVFEEAATGTSLSPPDASGPSTPVDAQPAPQGGQGDAPVTVAGAPYLRLLGQVEIEHVDRPELLPGRGIELLAYLLHHRQPLAGAQIQKALWPTTHDRTNGNLRSLAKQVRAALGHDPDGHLWLPEGRGNAGFTTHPAIRSDWDEFQHLTAPHPTDVPTAQLANALRLVHGQPLLGTDGHRGRWAWRAPLEEAIIAGVQDAAVVLAERAIADGGRDLVKLAVLATRFADPLSELSWQIELREATASGTPAQVERTVADLHATAGYGNPDYEPDAETSALIQAARTATAGGRP